MKSPKDILLNSLWRLCYKSPRLIRMLCVAVINFFLNIGLLFTKTPSFIIFFVTSRCNASCGHCFYRPHINTPQGEIGLNDIKKVALSLKNSCSLLITGGEPFLRDDISEICGIFHMYGRTRKIRITTNGYFTDRILASARKILRDKIDLTVQISLDALGDNHNTLRGLAGLFEKASLTILQLNGLKKQFPNLKVSVVATINKANCDKIDELSKYVKEKFDAELGLTLVRDSDVGIYELDQGIRSDIAILEESSKLPDQSELEHVLSKHFDSLKTERFDFIKDFSRLEKNIEMDIIFKAKRPYFRCLAGKTDVVIYPDGKVSLCEITHPFAKLRDFDYNLYRLLNSKEAAGVKKKLTHCYCMHPCHIISAMKHDASILLHIKDKTP